MHPKAVSRLLPILLLNFTVVLNAHHPFESEFDTH
jgi:hypothetical protein